MCGVFLFLLVSSNGIVAIFWNSCCCLVVAERYGTSLNIVELQQFEVLQDDYEVNWHLKTLKSSINPSAEDQRSRTAMIHNRRLAYMNRLVQDGQYFSEDAMRMRSPLLHFEHVGQFQVRILDLCKWKTLKDTPYGILNLTLFSWGFGIWGLKWNPMRHPEMLEWRLWRT